MLKSQGEEIGCSERWVASQEFIGNATQGILVTLLTDRFLELFRGHVTGSARAIDIFDARGSQSCSDAEVGNEGRIFCVEENIFWFEVPMNDVLLVGIMKRLPYL